ncbi:MAG: glycosyltransferase family 39 protein, partial [Legionella sp.]
MAFTNIHALKQFKINLALQRLNVDQLATLYILAFAFIYILVPCLLYPSIFPDSAQNIAWGHTWEWSYNRHPPLGTWFIKLMDMLLGNVNLATYSASACCLSLSLWFIYKLAKQYLAAQDALVACILSSFSVFYLIYYVFQYNQNTIMLPFWVMLCYFFDLCLRKNKLQDWLIVGALSAAALLAKYESAIILFLLFGYLCFHFKRDYLIHFISAFALCLFILAPHVISVIQKGWLPWVFLQ